MNEFVTDEGRRVAELVSKYGLINFYQYPVGNLIFAPHEMTIDVMSRVMKFLRENQEWVMGFEEDGVSPFIYVTPIEFLADCHGYRKNC